MKPTLLLISPLLAFGALDTAASGFVIYAVKSVTRYRVHHMQA